MPDTNEPLLRRLHRSLTPDAWRLLLLAETLAEEKRTPAYLVGGSVRDLLLGRPSPDIDLTIEGYAPAFARALAERAGLPSPRVHPAFQTATLHAAGLNIDVVTARSETYAAPGALPEVHASRLADDLARRDFTINAIAVAISGTERGTVHDPHGGRRDLELGLLRVLHPRSFEDDATRLLRAARYAARFRFRLAPETEALATSGRAFLESISPARIRHEAMRTLAEHDPARVLMEMHRLGLDEAILPGLRFNAPMRTRVRRLLADPDGHQETPWLLPALFWSEVQIAAYIARIDLTHRESVAAQALPAVRRALASLVRDGADDVEIVTRLERLPLPAVAAWCTAGPRSPRARVATHYLRDLRDVRPLLTSIQLQRLGVPPGPFFGAVIRALRDARLRDPSLSLDAEQRLVHDMLKANRGA